MRTLKSVGTNAKIKYLEGLRGVAALIVVFSHLKFAFFRGEYAQLNTLINDLPVPGILKLFIIELINVLSNGSLPVWVFWMLSSYVISILFFKKEENYDKIIVGYFSKRYLRLLIPVLASVLFAYALLKGGWMFSKPLSVMQGNDWLNSFYNFEPNLFVALRSAFYDSFFHFNFETTYNSVLWSIQNEFLGSMFTFAIFGIVRHNKRRFLLYAAIAFIVFKLQLYWLFVFIVGHVLCDYDFSDTNDKYILAIKRVEAKIHKHTILVFVGSFLFIILAKPIMKKIGVSGDQLLLFFSVFMVYCCCRNDYYKKLFSLKISAWLGYISFGLYLLHFPIICSISSYVVITTPTLTGKIIASLIALTVSLLLSVPFTKYIDKKGVKLANKVGDYFKRYT